MKPSDLFAKLQRKGANKERLAAAVAREPELIPRVLEGLTADQAKVRFGCASLLEIISQVQPALLQGYWNEFLKLLESENNIFRWIALRVVANLAREDSDHRFDAIFEKYFSVIPGPEMIAAANAIQGGARVAEARPQLADRIAAEILKVERAQYKTAECRNVAIGHAITALDQFYGQVGDRSAVLAFVRRARRNSRHAVQVKAQRFLKRHTS